MSTLVLNASSDIVAVEFTDHSLIVTLADSRRLEAPLAQYPRLLHATPAQRARWRLIGGGAGIHWEELDEDLSLRRRRAA